MGKHKDKDHHHEGSSDDEHKRHGSENSDHKKSKKHSQDLGGNSDRIQSISI